MKRPRADIPDPENSPTAYRDPEALRTLYRDRGWRRVDIAEFFGVTTTTIDRHLERHNIRRDTPKSHPPNGDGLAKQLYEIGLKEARS